MIATDVAVREPAPRPTAQPVPSPAAAFDAPARDTASVAVGVLGRLARAAPDETTVIRRATTMLPSHAARLGVGAGSDVGAYEDSVDPAFRAGSDQTRDRLVGEEKEADKHLKHAGKVSNRLAAILAKAAATPANKKIIAAGLVKIGAGVANIASGGLATGVSAAIGASTVVAAAGEETVMNRSKRQLQGRDQRSTGGQLAKSAGQLTSNTVKAAGAGAAKMGVVAAAEVTASSIPILGGFAQIGLGLKSISDAMDHALAQGLLAQEKAMLRCHKEIVATRKELQKLVNKAKRAKTQSDYGWSSLRRLEAAVVEVDRAADELARLVARIKKIANKRSLSTRFKRWMFGKKDDDEPGYELPTGATAA